LRQARRATKRLRRQQELSFAAYFEKRALIPPVVASIALCGDEATEYGAPFMPNGGICPIVTISLSYIRSKGTYWNGPSEEEVFLAGGPEGKDQGHIRVVP